MAQWAVVTALPDVANQATTHYRSHNYHGTKPIPMPR
jgi:hypothetical protein